MRRALRLAARGRYRTHPNPQVGAVVVRDGRVVGEGWHRRVGGPHAEVEALRMAGEQARGATVVVTLEPCRHFGRTPPCTDALVAAGIARVVVAHLDPDPRMRGEGASALRRAGVEVEWGMLAEEALRLNLRYLVPRLLARPQVTLKWAMSLDGKIATAGGESQWISSPLARRWALALREEHDAVLIGSGTALADDPRLDRRLGLANGAAIRVVLDRRLRLATSARLFTAAGELLLYTESRDGDRRRELEERGATVVPMSTVDPAAVLADLHARGVASVLVEGGSRVAASFARAGLFDRIACALAPRLLGGASAPGPLGGDGLGSLADAPELDGTRRAKCGRDLVIDALRAGCLRELSAKLGGS